jgi:asparagine synthase (glutamine-hydrolysing)
MCGISGIYAYHYASNPVDRVEPKQTRCDMAARGPDEMGEWISEDAHVAFGHRRLTVVDLSEAGQQPMVSADGALAVTIEGTIDNDQILRSRLQKEGFSFRTASDAEVLLHLYAQRGEQMVENLRGTFAFAIWDSVRRQLLLARDPQGVKPLYYCDDGWIFRFASQLEALLAGGGVSRNPDPLRQTGFYPRAATPGPLTSDEDIRAIPAGSILRVDSVGTHEPKRYFSIPADAGFPS